MNWVLILYMAAWQLNVSGYPTKEACEHAAEFKGAGLKHLCVQMPLVPITAAPGPAHHD